MPLAITVKKNVVTFYLLKHGYKGLGYTFGKLKLYPILYSRSGFPVALMVKNPPAMWETRV